MGTEKLAALNGIPVRDIRREDVEVLLASLRPNRRAVPMSADAVVLIRAARQAA